MVPIRRRVSRSPRDFIEGELRRGYPDLDCPEIRASKLEKKFDSASLSLHVFSFTRILAGLVS